MLIFLFVSLVYSSCTDCFNDTIYIWGMNEDIDKYGLSTCQGIVDCTIVICNVLNIPGTFAAGIQIGNSTRPNIPPLTQVTSYDATCTERVAQIFIFGYKTDDCLGLFGCGEAICKMHQEHPGYVCISTSH